MTAPRRTARLTTALSAAAVMALTTMVSVSASPATGQERVFADAASFDTVDGQALPMGGGRSPEVVAPASSDVAASDAAASDAAASTRQQAETEASPAGPDPAPSPAAEPAPDADAAAAQQAPRTEVSTEVTPYTVTLTWTVAPNGSNVSAVYAGRDGVSAGGHREWESAEIIGTTGTVTFKNLIPATSYTVYAQPVVNGQRGAKASVTVTTSNEGDTPPPPTGTEGTPGTLTNGCTYDQRGIPTCGAYLGAAYGANADPTAWERNMGAHLGLHRTYYAGGGVDRAVRTAAADLAVGRLPWISFKLPKSWPAMADGQGDAWVRDLTTRLSKLNGPVWVAFHHEPEGDGDIAAWTRMQAHLAPLVHSLAPNVAYTIILTGYHQLFGAAQYHLDSLWPKNTAIDMVGFDVYNKYGVTRDGVRSMTPTDMVGKYFTPISTWAKAHNVAWGLGETGFTDEAAAVDPQWVTRTYDQMQKYGGVAFAYFNTNLNSVANWSLTTTLKQNAFTTPLRTSSKLH
jgi:hypothetical protein